MTPDQFFAKFALLSETPNAVAKMRELILDLAVRGKLVSDADKKCSELREYRLRELCSLITDGEHATPQRVSAGVPLATAKNVRDGYLDLTDTDWVSAETALKCWRRCRPAHGDILMVCVGATTGRLCIAENPPDMVLVRSVALLRPRCELITPYYLSIFLKSRSGQRQIWSNVKQSAQPCLYLGKMSDFVVSIPSLAEQKRIVAKVDELMALCDQLESQQKQRETKKVTLVQAALTRFTDAPTPGNLEFLFHKSYAIDPAELRKTILTLAVTGRLVAQSQDDEQVLTWLSRSFPAKSLVEPSDVDFPVACPSMWQWFRIENLCEVAGGIQKTPSRIPRQNAYPYLGVGNVYRGRLDLKDVKKFELEPGELDRRRLARGDLLIIEGNGSFNEIGRCAKWNGEIDNCVHQNHVIRCRPFDESVSDWILLYLNSPSGTETMQKLAITSSGLYSLSVGKIRQILFPLPPLAEQKRIVAKVEELMALVDKLEAQLAASRDAGAKLIEAVVAELARAA